MSDSNSRRTGRYPWPYSRPAEPVSSPHNPPRPLGSHLRPSTYRPSPLGPTAHPSASIPRPLSPNPRSGTILRRGRNLIPPSGPLWPSGQLLKDSEGNLFDPSDPFLAQNPPPQIHITRRDVLCNRLQNPGSFNLPLPSAQRRTALETPVGARQPKRRAAVEDELFKEREGLDYIRQIQHQARAQYIANRLREQEREQQRQREAEQARVQAERAQTRAGITTAAATLRRVGPALARRTTYDAFANRLRDAIHWGWTGISQRLADAGDQRIEHENERRRRAAERRRQRARRLREERDMIARVGFPNGITVPDSDDDTTQSSDDDWDMDADHSESENEDVNAGPGPGPNDGGEQTADQSIRGNEAPFPGDSAYDGPERPGERNLGRNQGGSQRPAFEGIDGSSQDGSLIPPSRHPFRSGSSSTPASGPRIRRGRRGPFASSIVLPHGGLGLQGAGSSSGSGKGKEKGKRVEGSSNANGNGAIDAKGILLPPSFPADNSDLYDDDPPRGWKATSGATAPSSGTKRTAVEGSKSLARASTTKDTPEDITASCIPPATGSVIAGSASLSPQLHRPVPRSHLTFGSDRVLTSDLSTASTPGASPHGPFYCAQCDHCTYLQRAHEEHLEEYAHDASDTPFVRPPLRLIHRGGVVRPNHAFDSAVARIRAVGDITTRAAPKTTTRTTPEPTGTGTDTQASLSPPIPSPAAAASEKDIPLGPFYCGQCAQKTYSYRSHGGDLRSTGHADDAPPKKKKALGPRGWRARLAMEGLLLPEKKDNGKHGHGDGKKG